ncbi:MAG: glycosyl transferase family 2 [Candidatus Marinimicrobia bacterium]|nr:glycosyl transferase family 2 [Candidatus Neomarinimicrobiota bacterium]
MTNKISGFLFSIIKPIWYLSLENNDTQDHWVDYRKLNQNEKTNIDYCEVYESDNFSLFDASYQALQKGIIDIKGERSLNLPDNLSVSLNDQYLFLRRMFKPIWVYYVLLIRILTFKISFVEITAFFRSRKIKKIDFENSYFINTEYDNFISPLLTSTPKISIIIPTLNRYGFLSDALYDIQKQLYNNYEIIIVDQSVPFKRKFYEKFDLNIKLIHQNTSSLWKARNSAIKKAKGDYILFFDDDSRVENNWIQEHLKCLDFYNADISAGVSLSLVGAPVPSNYNYFRWADQLDTGNVLVKRNVFQICGLFDRQFEGMRMGDGEFGARAHQKGLKNIINPIAKRIHLKVPSGGLRELGSWDGLHPKNIFSPRPIPSVLYFYRKYWGDKLARLFIIQTIPSSLMPYFMKGRYIGYIFSFIIFFFCLPLVIFQVYRSWHISSEMIEEGSKIESFK